MSAATEKKNKEVGKDGLLRQIRVDATWHG